MLSEDLSTRTLPELLAAHIAILDEVRRRGLSRTRGSLAGELAERITLGAYGGTLETAGKKNIDLIDQQGRSVQVKARALDPGVNRIFAFSSFHFDVLVAVMFDAQTFQIQWARELTGTEASEMGRYRVPSADWAIATSKVKRAGIDITERMAVAYSALDS